MLLLLLLTAGLVANSQNKAQNGVRKLFSRDELHEDYLLFRKALETTYPSLYRFADSLTITNYLDDHFKSLDRPMTEIEFYKIIVYQSM